MSCGATGRRVAAVSTTGPIDKDEDMSNGKGDHGSADEGRGGDGGAAAGMDNGHEKNYRVTANQAHLALHK